MLVMATQLQSVRGSLPLSLPPRQQETHQGSVQDLHGSSAPRLGTLDHPADHTTLQNWSGTRSEAIRTSPTSSLLHLSPTALIAHLNRSTAPVRLPPLPPDFDPTNDPLFEERYFRLRCGDHFPSHYKDIASSIICGHRPPPSPPAIQPPAIQPPLGLVAALLGEGVNGDQPQAMISLPEDASSVGSRGHATCVSELSPVLETIPERTDIREILSRCEDASLSWSLQFWVTIADPLTGHVFFACPASGQCSWDPPVGAFVVPRSPDGEWWELADPSRQNRSYYYNTLTSVTQWERPEGDAFVIPLGLIQRNALPAQPGGEAGSSSTSSPDKQTNSTADSHNSSVRFAQVPVVHQAPGHERQGADQTDKDQSSRQTARRASTKDTVGSVGLATPGHDGLSLPPEPEVSDESHSWWERARTTKKQRPRVMDISPVFGHAQGGLLASPPRSPIPVDDVPHHETATGQNLSLVLQPSSPTTASYNMKDFSSDMFADRYFATKRSGVLRQRLPLDRIMEWQRTPITSPLLVLTKASVQDAITTFKVIQHVMGERDRPVDGAAPPAAITAVSSPSVLSLAKAKLEAAPGHDEKSIVLEEIRWMIQLGVGRIEMRDEIYCQLIKQLTRNPDQDAVVLGFQLFCVLAQAFGPSKSFEQFVRGFLVRNVERSEFGIGVMSKFCLSRFDSWVQKGGRGRVLTIAEIEHASDAAFYPSVYGQTLETIMQRQEGAYPELKVPIILPFLADGILALGGTETEGIFRVAGDTEVIAELKARIDRGHYQLGGVDDPHVTASLFKLWLRELEEPLIPTRLYNTALESSKNVDNTIIFLKKLPDHNRKVLTFVISFIQLFLDDEVIVKTKMTPQNLALVLAPNILRTTSDSLVTVFTNSTFESQFVLNLLLHLDPPSVDPDYVPTHGATGRTSLESDAEEIGPQN